MKTKEQKRQEAQERQANWDALSDKEKLQKVFDRCGHHNSNEAMKIKKAKA